MLTSLPKQIAPYGLCEKHTSIQGKLPVSALERVQDFLANTDGEVDVVLVFGKDGRQARIEGHIKAVLSLKCQRCLEAVQWPIDAAFKLGLVTTFEQVGKLSDDYEPFMLGEDETTLVKDIVEDEILLLIPDIPKHEQDCKVDLPKNKQNLIQPAEGKATENPFSILADIYKQEK